MTKTQEDRIIDWLAAGHALTAAQAYAKFGCLRLAARIYDLRRVIKIDRTLEHRGASHWAVYRLAK
jgi:hypothetical protein